MSGTSPMEIDPMEVDPIDGGPKPPVSPMNTPHGKSHVIPPSMSKEEEARQAIEMLRDNEVSNRVAAANRLDSVAVVLGQERTRSVSFSRQCKYVHDIFDGCCACLLPGF